MTTKKQKIVLLIAFIPAFLLLFFLTTSHAHAALTPLWQVLQPGNTTSGMGKVVSDVWTYMMAACNTLVFAMLIAVAFMNILRIQLDSYAVKKILPAFIMAVILANFSFLICRIIIDIGNIVMSLFLAGSDPGSGPIAAASGPNQISNAFEAILAAKVPTPDGTGAYWGLIGIYIVKEALAIVGAVMVFILAFIFLVRNYYIYFLVAIAPVGFMAMFLPVTNKYFKEWWSQFTKWVFMPVVSLFWLWLAGLFIKSMPTGGGWLLTTAFAYFCFYMAIKSPFSLNKAAVGAWADWGKKAWGKTGGAAWNATGGAAVKAGKDYVNFQYGVGKNWAKEGARKLPIIRSIDRRIGKGQVTRDLYARKAAKQETLRKNANFVNFINDKGPKWLEGADKVTRGRVTAVLGDMAKEETGPNYKDQYTVRDLAGKQLYHKAADGTRTRADVYKILSDPAYRAQIEDYFGKSKQGDMADSEKRASALAEYIAATQEIRRRYNQKKAATHLDKSMGDDRSQTIEDFYINEGIYQTKDYRDLSRREGGENDALLPPPVRYRQEDRRDQRAGIPVEDEDELPEDEEEGETSGRRPTGEHLANLANVERLLEEMNEKLGERSDDKTAADALKPSSVGVGVLKLPDEINVRLKSMDPGFVQNYKTLQQRISQENNRQLMSLQQKESGTLMAIAEHLRNGSDPAKIHQQVAEARQKLESGDTAAAAKIATDISPGHEAMIHIQERQGQNG